MWLVSLVLSPSLMTKFPSPLYLNLSQYYLVLTSRQDADDTGSRLRAYADKCMFDIFIDIYKEDYAGSDDGASKSKMVHKICKKF